MAAGPPMSTHTPRKSRASKPAGRRRRSSGVGVTVTEESCAAAMPPPEPERATPKRATPKRAAPKRSAKKFAKKSTTASPQQEPLQTVTSGEVLEPLPAAAAAASAPAVAEAKALKKKLKRQSQKAAKAVQQQEGGQLKAAASLPVPPLEPEPERTTAAAASAPAAAAEPAKLVKLRRKLERAQAHLAGCDATKRKQVTASVAALQQKLAVAEGRRTAAAAEIPRRPAALDLETPTPPPRQPARLAPQQAQSIGWMTESSTTRSDRAARFENTPTGGSRWLWHGDVEASPTGKGASGGPSSVVGTCTTLEKEYARVPAGMVPDPANIRPAKVLRAALKLVLQRWKDRPPAERGEALRAAKLAAAASPATSPTAADKDASPTYAWVTSQLRAIRQDLTVQNLRGVVARRCYAAAVRCALDASDWAEFSPSLSRLFELYGEDDQPPPAEFHAYRMLKYLAEALRQRTASSVALAEQLRHLVTEFSIPPHTALQRSRGVKGLLAEPPLVHSRKLLECVIGGRLWQALALTKVEVVEQHGHAAWLVQEQIASPLQAMQIAMLAKAVRSQPKRPPTAPGGSTQRPPAAVDRGVPAGAPAKKARASGGKKKTKKRKQMGDDDAAAGDSDALQSALLAENTALSKRAKKAKTERKEKTKKKTTKKMKKKKGTGVTDSLDDDLARYHETG